MLTITAIEDASFLAVINAVFDLVAIRIPPRCDANASDASTSQV